MARTPIDIMAAFQQDPPELDFIWSGFLVGTVGALVAPGATGKSFWAIEAAMSVAAGIESADLVGLKPSSCGPVAYYAAEDPLPAIIKRVNALGTHLDSDARRYIAENLRIYSTMGERVDVMSDEHVAEIIEECRDCRLIVFDTLSRIHGLDENSNGQMSLLISQLEYMAKETGAAVLYLHHISKGSAKDGSGDQQQAGRGASALIDNARWCGFVSKMTEKESESLSDRSYDRQCIGKDAAFRYVRFGISKQNYDAPHQDKWYQRREGGVLLPIEIKPVTNGTPSGRGRRDEV